MLVEELRQIRHNLIQNEDRLAQLHADIYKRREEARNIRLSMPTPEYLDRVQLGQDVVEKLEKKKKKSLCSILKLQEHTRKDLEKYSQKSPPSIQCWFYLKIFLVVVVLIVVGLYLATHKNDLLQDPSTACR